MTEVGSAIEIINVSKSFDGVTAVDEVSVSVAPGEIFALLGGSGCNKTTLLRMLAGFEIPTTGEIKIAGQSMLGKAPYERPNNMMFQSYALFPHMNVEQNIAFGLKQEKLSTGEITNRVTEVLALVQMEQFRKRKPASSYQAVNSAEEIFNEIASLTPSYAGVTYPRLEGEGIQWPCPTPQHPGTPYLHKDGRFTRGKGLFHAIEYKGPAEVVDKEYPLWMTTGRVYAHYHTGTMTRNSASLDAEISQGFLEIHPQDAAELDLCDGGWYSGSRRGVIRN